MVYSPLTRRPAADHGHGPVRLGSFSGRYFGIRRTCPGKYLAGILKLVAF
jgi:hypothetical protein